MYICIRCVFYGKFLSYDTYYKTWNVNGKWYRTTKKIHISISKQ